MSTADSFFMQSFASKWPCYFYSPMTTGNGRKAGIEDIKIHNSQFTILNSQFIILNSPFPSINSTVTIFAEPS